MLTPLCFSVFFGIDKYSECVLGSGQSYRGTIAVTKSGSRCLPWDSPAIKHKLNNAWRSDALELGLGSHSFCRYGCQNMQYITHERFLLHAKRLLRYLRFSLHLLHLYQTGIQMVMWVRGVTPTRTCSWPGSCATYLNAVSSLIFIVSFYSVEA